VALDPWSQTALQDWLAEASAAGRPLIANWSVVDEGVKELTHQSAENSYGHHINLTPEVADLSWTPARPPFRSVRGPPPAVPSTPAPPSWASMPSTA